MCEKNSAPKVSHRKIMLKTFEVYQKPFHSHDWQSRFRSLPCHFPQKFRRKLKFNPTYLPTKTSGTPNIPEVEMKHPFSKTLKSFSFEDSFCALDLSRMKKCIVFSGFFEANPVWFHLMVSIKMDKSKAAMKMPERWWPQTILALEEETAIPKSSPLLHLFGESA